MLQKFPALTLWQPWGSAIIYPPDDLRKGVENRNWPPPIKIIRKRIVIHAGMTYDTEVDDWEPLQKALAAIHPDLRRVKGCVLGTVFLESYLKPTNGKADPPEIRAKHHPWRDPWQYSWILSDPKPFPEPIPACGHQGIWYWDVPEGGEG